MLTVLLATRNRAPLLREVLEAFCRLQPPASGWKLVVVDNGSTDETAQVLASFGDRLPLHSVSEPRLGKNLALNTGLGLVEGDLTVLTDDDVFPHADWLVQLRKAADAQPAYAMFGGAVLPRWEVPPPCWVEWLEPGPVYTLTDPTRQDGPVPPFLIYGPNMAVRTSVFQSGTRFDPSIGPRGSNYPMGSETELAMRLDRQGHKAWYVHNAVVEHFVSAEHLTTVWVLKRAVRYGRGQLRLFGAVKIASAHLWFGVPRYLLRDLVKAGLTITAAWALRRQKALFRARWRFNYRYGQTIEARILARERGASAPSVPIPTSSDP